MQSCANGRCFGKKTSLCVMFFMTSTFFVAEIVVGYITNSTALVADSFHMLSDVLSLIIGFLAVLYSKRNSKYNTYGWARAEVLGALANAVFLLALCFTIIVSAIQRLVDIETIENPLLVLYVGVGGLVINILGLVLFHGHTHGHNHGHDEEQEAEYETLHVKNKPAGIEDVQPAKMSKKRGSQMNMKGVFLHVLGDALGSVVVIVSALTIHLAEGDWRFYIDPAMSLVIAIIIIFTTWPLLKRSGLILLQHPPAHIGIEDLIAKLTKVEGIYSIHDFHLWQLSGNIIIVSAHITLHKKDNFNEAVLKASKIFHDKGIHSFTLQPEYYECSERQSVCGIQTCPYLKPTLKSPAIGSSSNSDEENFKALHQTNGFLAASTCRLPCVSTKCQAYQCCSRDRKTPSSSSKDKNHQNNVFVVDVSMQKVDEQNGRL